MLLPQAVACSMLLGVFAIAACASTGPTPAPSSSPGASAVPGTPVVAASPSPAPELVFPKAGPLATATHAATIEGVSFAFEASRSGWVADSGETWAKLDLDPVPPLDGLPDGAAVLFWSPDGVFNDPCGHVRATPVGRAATDLAAAIATIPGIAVTGGPSDTTLGGLPAVLVELAVPEQAACAPEELYLWYDTVEAWRWATALGDRIQVWIVEANGARLVIEAETRRDPGIETEADVERLVASIRFE